MISFSSLSKRPGATLAGVFSLAVGSVLLLCGAGSVPVENFLPQGTMQSDLDAGGHNLTNAATVSATNVVVSGSLTAPASFTLPFSQLAGTPTTLSGYGISDPIVLTSGAYGNPAWITSLAYSKLSGAPTLGSLAALSPTGTAGSSTYLRGDNSWATVPSGYTLPAATTTTLGGVIVPASGGLTVTAGSISLTADSSVLAALPQAVNTAGGLVVTDGSNFLPAGMLGNDIGVNVQAWSANLDSWAEISTDASVITASQVATNSFNGLVQLSSGQLPSGITLSYPDGSGLSGSAGMDLIFYPSNQGYLADGNGGFYSNLPAGDLMVSAGQGNPTTGQAVDPSVVAGFPLVTGSAGGFLTLDAATGSIDYPGSTNPLGDTSGNFYSNLAAGSLIVSGGTGAPTAAAADVSTAPTNTVTPVGWLPVTVNGTPSWIPYYQ